MEPSRLFLLILFLLPSLLAAQGGPGASTLSDFASARLRWTWFATVGGGVGGHDNGPFSRRLQQYAPRDADGSRMLYQTETISNVGLSLSGAAGLQIGDALLLGVSGERLFIPEFLSRNPAGDPQDGYLLAGWGGGLDIGYVLVNRDATLLFPFLHAGWYGYSLEFANRHGHAIPFFEGEPVEPMTTATYTGAAPRIAIGVGMVSFLGDTPGTLLVGARVTYGTMPGRPEWEQDGTVVNNGGHTPAYNAVTLSLYVGLGSASGD